MPYLKKAIKEPKIKKVNKEDRLKIYQSARWKKLRLAKLMDLPLCEICLAKGIVTPAIDIHHKDSFLNYEGLARVDKAFDYNNLLSLCKECHSYLHRCGTTRG